MAKMAQSKNKDAPIENRCIHKILCMMHKNILPITTDALMQTMKIIINTKQSVLKLTT